MQFAVLDLLLTCKSPEKPLKNADLLQIPLVDYRALAQRNNQRVTTCQQFRRIKWQTTSK
jgi:hypothetical protein